MIRPVRAIRETRERIAGTAKVVKDISVTVRALECALAGVEQQLERQTRMSADLTRAVDAVQRAVDASARRHAELRALVDESSRASREGGADIDRQLRKHATRMKALQSAVKTFQSKAETQFTKVQERLSKLRGPFDAPPDGVFLDCARPLIESRRTLLGYDRLYVLWQAVRNTIHLDLPAVEIGSFRGGSAFLIGQALRLAAGSDRELHVVDTFEGHIDRQVTAHDADSQRGKFSETSCEDVREYLAGFTGVSVHQGDAPEVIRAWPDRRYALVHLDVDLYEPTRDCLEYFAPRMACGGVIVLDDYGASSCPGVARAVREVIDQRSDVQRWDTQTEQLVLVRR